MPRPVFAVATSLLLVGACAAQCPPWYTPYPVAPSPYPLTPAIWGAPLPRPLPPLAPRPIPTVREEDEPAAPAPKASGEPKNGTKSDGVPKEKDAPRIPKTKFPVPGDPLDKVVPDVPKTKPKSQEAKTDAPDAGRFEQYVIPTDGRGAPRAEVKVGFFNHADREIVLDVNGDPVKLPKEQYVTLRLPRTFTWAESGARSNSVVVPPDAEGIEIVFRR
jgi:hypothetical protein